jgi:hypothetical protein
VPKAGPSTPKEYQDWIFEVLGVGETTPSPSVGWHALLGSAAGNRTSRSRRYGRTRLTDLRHAHAVCLYIGCAARCVRQRRPGKEQEAERVEWRDPWCRATSDVLYEVSDVDPLV